MAAVGRPRRETGAPRAMRDPDAAARLLATAAQACLLGRDPVARAGLGRAATFCVTGIREGEAVALGMGSPEGTPGARRLQVVGKGNKIRAMRGRLENALEAYLVTRRARFPRHDLDQDVVAPTLRFDATPSPPRDSPDSRRVTLESPRFSRVGLRPGELGCPPGAELGHRC